MCWSSHMRHMHPLMHTQSTIHTAIHSCTHSPIHTAIHSCTHSPIHTAIHSCTHRVPSTQPSTHAHTHSHPLMHTHSPIHTAIHSCTHRVPSTQLSTHAHIEYHPHSHSQNPFKHAPAVVITIMQEWHSRKKKTDLEQSNIDTVQMNRQKHIIHAQPRSLYANMNPEK